MPNAELFSGLQGFDFEDLFDAEKLEALDAIFLESLESTDAPLAERLREARRNPDAVSRDAYATLLTAAAPHVANFLERVFPIAEARRAAFARAEREAVLGRFKRDFLGRRASKAELPEGFEKLDAAEQARELGRLERALIPGLDWDADEELSLARACAELLDAEAEYDEVLRQKKKAEVAPETRRKVDAWRSALGESGDDSPEGERAFLGSLLQRLERAARLRMEHPVWRESVRGWSSFRAPEKLDFGNLIHTTRPDPELPERRRGLESHRRRRDGFKLTGHYMTPREVTAETRYCLLCHERDKDSCSKGFRAPDGAYTRNPLGAPLTGCPLDEKISEMHTLRRAGDPVAALAVICVDNPMCAGTGHRICNDCMKACIYQKQTPVNIPQIETGILSEVLAMPFGFEVYSLLTRWNPLRLRRPFPRRFRGRSVLVVGLGPAGYTLALHLLNEGFGVVAVDGLKIEPFPRDRRPIESFAALRRDLDERPLAGFGGVSEYGITVRWDKNFLTVAALNLSRRRHFEMFGGVRFGGTLTAPGAFELGFDHVAIAAGAGRPTIVPMENGLLRGIRQSSDFLMALQLTGAFRRNALANLEVELPAIVIGGGLTAVDSATELLAYYPVQVERALSRYEALAEAKGEGAVRSSFDPEELAILDRMLDHARQIRAERRRAESAGEKPDLAGLCRSWGGVSIVYRRRLEESPAYRVNHEEALEAFEEGIDFVEGLTPVAAVPDAHGHLSAMRFRRASGETVELPVRTCVVAAGTAPNIAYEREHPGTFPLDPTGHHFAPHRVELDGGAPRLVPSDDDAPGAFFCGRDFGGRFVTFFGDNHPAYAGNVVRSMASAKHGAPWISALFASDADQPDGALRAAREEKWRSLVERLQSDWTSTVESVRRIAPDAVELVVRAPGPAGAYRPGQIFRLQNFEAGAPAAEGAPLLMEPFALACVERDETRGTLAFVAVEAGVSSRLCAYLRPGERVALMGPSGAGTRVPESSTILLCGQDAGHPMLLSIGRECRRQGARVLYFAGFGSASRAFLLDEIEAASDAAVVAVASGPPLPARRAADRSFVGTLAAAMEAYAAGRLGEPALPLSEASTLVVAGPEEMMAAVDRARRESLAPHLALCRQATASVNSPMQCMMKEVCAQCLQVHRDPETGRPAAIVYSCFDQNQAMERVDWEALAGRLRQNRMSEKLAALDFARRVAAAGLSGV